MLSLEHVTDNIQSFIKVWQLLNKKTSIDNRKVGDIKCFEEFYATQQQHHGRYSHHHRRRIP